MFAIVIMKYFIAICTCILLLCSFNSTNKGGIIRECPPEVISSISMLSDDTNSYRQLSTEKRYDAPNVKLSEVNLLCFTLRTPMFTKTSKPLSTIKVLCHYRILLPEQKFNSLYPSINYVKSSCKYFIYTLGHILISQIFPLTYLRAGAVRIEIILSACIHICVTLRCEYHYNSEFNTILPTKSHLYYNATLIFIHIGHDGAYFPHRFFCRCYY